MLKIDEIIKHLEDLEYRINGSELEVSVVRDQLSALVGIVTDVAVDLSKLRIEVAKKR